MSTLYISEYQYASRSQATPEGVPAGMEPSVTTQVVAITAGSVQSAAFNPLTHFVRLHSDVVCSVQFGANPTATTNSARMASGQTEFFGVIPGQIVAVIANT